MIKVSRTAINAEGELVTIELTLGQEGGSYTKTHGDVVQEMMTYSLDEYQTIFELMQMLDPHYKNPS